MSKRLPYYQFEPAEYLAGDIMFCSYGAQGVFATLCALYWQKDCKLSLEPAKRRINNSDTYFDELIKEGIIKLNGNEISISFLDNQFKDITEKSVINSINGKKGAEVRWRKNGESIAGLFLNDGETDGESIALRENKIIEDNIIENNIKENNIKDKPLAFSFYSSLINHGADKQLISDWLKVRKNKNLTNTETALNSFLNEVNKSKTTINGVLTKCIENSWGGYKSEWITKTVTTNNNSMYLANGMARGVL